MLLLLLLSLLLLLLSLLSFNFHTGDDIPAVVTIKVVAYKGIGHCLTSSLAMTFCFYLPYYAQVQGLVLIAGMHFWFNSVLTQDSWFYVCFGRSGRLASDFWVRACLIHIHTYPFIPSNNTPHPHIHPLTTPLVIFG